MFNGKLVRLVTTICVCLIGINSALLAEPLLSIDIDYPLPVGEQLHINGDWDNPNSATDYDFVNFLPGASTAGEITINAGGEVHLYGGTFDSEFGPDFEGWIELSCHEGVLVIHGTQFWVSGQLIPDGTTYVDIDVPTTPYPAGPYGFHNIQWQHHDGTIYNIWAGADTPISLSTEPFGGSEPENLAPVADAGGPYTAGSVDGGPVAVDLTAAASSDPDGEVITYSWDLDNDGTYETDGVTVNINSFPVGTSTIGLIVTDNLGLQSEPVTATVTVTQLAPEIIVYPEVLAHDYGDVEVGVAETYVIQILNAGLGNLNISSISIAGNADFAITTAPTPTNGVIVIAPDEIATTDVEITFTPSVEGFVQAVLTIVSDDADESTVDVLLSGSGTIIEVPVEQQIADTITFFNQSLADGTIVGYAPRANAKAVENRVKALDNMLEAAGTLIELGETQTAIEQLNAIAKKTDGEKRPPDFVIGDGVAQLNQMVNDIIAALSI